MYNLICACTDLGVHIDGTDKGPLEIAKYINDKKINDKIIIKKNNCIKEKNKDNYKKNLKEINIFLKKLYLSILDSFNDDILPITLGGDHTVAISSILASNKHNPNLGVIWIDAHTDFNTFETTETGNIHGLPLAACCGLCNELTNHISNKYIDPKKCVVVGARSIDKEEYNNLKKYGVTIFTTNDLIKEGITQILNKAFEIAGDNIHISFDLDVIDPKEAKGVSVPEKNGITTQHAIEIFEYLVNKKSIIKSLDIVEYNPSFDDNNKTLNIAVNLLKKFINNDIQII